MCSPSGGFGPPYPLSPQSFRSSLAPTDPGSRSSGISVVSGGRFQASQWSHTFPTGSTAFGSSTRRGSDDASSGTPEIRGTG